MCYTYLPFFLIYRSDFYDWALLFDISMYVQGDCTSSSVHGSAPGSSARNHWSTTFHSLNPGGRAVTGTFPCHPLQLTGVIPMQLLLWLVLRSSALVLPHRPEPNAPLLSLFCQFFGCLHRFPQVTPASLRRWQPHKLPASHPIE